MDEALKKGEAIHSNETETTTTNCYQKTDAAEYSSNENADTTGTDCSSYDDFTAYSGYNYGQAWNYSQHYQTDECGSTNDPYRENMASKPEAPSDLDSTEPSISEPLRDTADRLSS